MIVIGLPKLGAAPGIAQRGVSPQKLQGCVYSGTEYLAIGLSRTQGWGGPLPMAVPPALSGGYPCLLWTSGEWLLGPGGLGYGQYLFIPQDTRLLGLRLYAQWFVYYRNDGPGCGHLFQRWMTSNCAELVIGY